MNLLKRLRNLWRMSDYEFWDKYENKMSKPNFFNPPKAEIIKRTNPIDDFIKQNGAK